MAKSRIQLIISIAFLATSLALFSQTNRYFAPPTLHAIEVPSLTVPVNVPVSNRAEELRVEGVWEQYSVIDGKREFMAQLEIRSDGVHYVATPMSIAEDVFPKHSYRSFNHKYDNGVWTFSEEWAPGEIGDFSLTRLSDNEFVGAAYPINSGFGFETVFVRISD